MHFELYEASAEFVASIIQDSDNLVAWENIAFTPPADGSEYYRFNYKEADTVTTSLDRKCAYFVGMVQVDVVFSPGSGISVARKLAADVAKSAIDGTMLSTGYILSRGAVHPAQKSDTGWFIPVRFYVRCETKGA
ncbi:tail terminator [Enterobacter phage Ec_L1]|uniref:Minor tail protein n=1 Tax=Enterobacter phage Ec_L1 TaxID=2070180 RepID=A0A2P0WA15_9CAUD|nr:tail terminator [Enterobacter phage Ec_L1]AUV57183.1 hypothetical protein Ec69 [Enterobacter phage Ec_L1]